jgi:hydroxylamine reductase
MYCYQCQETAKGKGCTVVGVCGKNSEVAELQDLFIYLLKGLSVCALKVKKQGTSTPVIDDFIIEGLFSTITNVNFDPRYFHDQIEKAITVRDLLKEEYQVCSDYDAVNWSSSNKVETMEKAQSVGVLHESNVDVRSLKELLIYGLKGIAAYYHHASTLGYEDNSITNFVQQTMETTLDDTVSADALTVLVLKCGEVGVKTMALLDQANTIIYGNPEVTQVGIGVREKPGILISGHDLKDLDELLKQTEDTGVDVYTHGEMLPSHAYPAFKKYRHFIGNYGGSWWHQKDEFDSFHGPILMTTNCLVPPKDSYKDRVYSTSMVGHPKVKHIPDRADDGEKDFSAMISHAQQCHPPLELEQGELTIGFAHHTVLSVLDKIIEAVNSGKIKHFVVMAGCDGRFKSRDYYTEFAKALPDDSVILTAGCAKYRYNKLGLGDIDGIPRVLDAGQCNDSYSLVIIAQKLAEALDVNVNELPIVYNIAWYEQKATLILLSLLSLGIKNIMLGPTLPAFISKDILQVLVEKFNLRQNTMPEEDMPRLLGEVTSP